jgi:RNA polymerase sigma-70 factor, ECF subfamily
MQPPDWQRIEAESHPPGGAPADIVGRHWMALYGYCRSLIRDGHLAEDAVQETFLRTYKSAAKIDPAKMEAWLFTVARRCCLEIIRKRQRTAVHESAAGAVNSPSGRADGLDAIRDAVETLDEADREVIYLKHTSGLKCRQIADATGRPLGTVCSSLAKAYQKLRQRLGKRQR